MEVFERPTLAQVFRRFYPRYRQSCDVRAEQRRAAWSIHPHIHYIVPQGGIDAEGRWVSPRLKDQARFLFPIQAVSEVFRGRFLHRLEQLHAQGKLRFPDAAAESRFPDQLRLAASKPWQVYAQAPFAGPEPLLRYLSLYTHRAAISSGRLLECDDRSVSFAYKDYRQGGQTKTMRLGGEVFVGRFLQHVAPKGFRRIRHYGFLANGAGREAVRQVQEQWLTRVLILLAVLGQWGLLLDEGSGAGPDPGDWTPGCPFCGQGPLRYRQPRLERVRPEDTS